MLFILKTEIDRNKIISYLKRLPTKDLLGYKINIQSIRHTRSLNQNKYMWFIFDMIATETGEDRQRVHDYYCQKFLTEEIKIFDKIQKIIKGTSQLNTKQFEDFMLKVRTDASTELSVFCPLPNEVCNYE